jgi:signal transduction histidine kinase
VSDEEAGIRISPLPAAILTSDLQFASVNGPMREIVGSRPKARALPDVLDPRERAEVVEAFAKLRSAKATVRIEVRLGSREPHPVALLVAARLPRGSAGAFLVYLVDLASIHRSERWSKLMQDFERAASEWRRTFDAVELPIVIVDDLLNVTRINRAARMLVGKEYSEIIGHPIGELGETEPWKSIVERAADVRKRRSPAAWQVKDPFDRTLDVLMMLFNADDVTDGRVIAILWDVSALIDLQIRLDQQKTMATMGALVAGVAHEVRNPLFAISATIDAMEPMASTDLKEYFEVLREEIDRMTALMQDLLAFGRPAAPVFAETTVGSVIDAAMRASSTLANKQKVSVRKDVAHDVAITVDAGRLCRAVQNLIDNAVQHSPADSEVVVAVSAKERKETGYVGISVSDHGPGFTPDVVLRVFEPFFSRRRGGTGLGMSLVQQIVTEHGGEVSVCNANGGGGVVTIRLPASR